jgi:hypothetical protein
MGTKHYNKHCALKAISLVVLLLLIPDTAWADPPFVNPVVLPFVLLGECVPVLLETMVLRQWLNLRSRDVLPAVLTANAASVIVGLLLPHDRWFARQLAILADIEQFRLAYFEPVKPFNNLRTAEDVVAYHSQELVFQLLILTIIAILVEWPIYVWMLRKKTSRNVSIPAITANAISYPVYYTLIVVVAYGTQVLNWPTWVF